MRRWFVFGLVVIVVAVAMRYLMPPRLGHFGLAFRSGGVMQLIPINVVAFWLLLVIGVIIILFGVVTGRAHK